MTKYKRKKLLKERHLMYLANRNHEEDKEREEKDYHPSHPDNI